MMAALAADKWAQLAVEDFIADAEFTTGVRVVANVEAAASAFFSKRQPS
jgi:hypothetical protein